MEKKDFYKILEVPYNATEDDIKKAYRTKALKYHPDKNKGSKKAEEKFEKISAAYNVLKDRIKRKIYDNQAENKHKTTAHTKSEEKNNKYTKKDSKTTKTPNQTESPTNVKNTTKSNTSTTNKKQTIKKPKNVKKEHFINDNLDTNSSNKVEHNVKNNQKEDDSNIFGNIGDFINELTKSINLLNETYKKVKDKTKDLFK